MHEQDCESSLAGNCSVQCKPGTYLYPQYIAQCEMTKVGTGVSRWPSRHFRLGGLRCASDGYGCDCGHLHWGNAQRRIIVLARCCARKRHGSHHLGAHLNTASGSVFVWWVPCSISLRQLSGQVSLYRVSCLALGLTPPKQTPPYTVHLTRSCRGPGQMTPTGPWRACLLAKTWFSASCQPR